MGLWTVPARCPFTCPKPCRLDSSDIKVQDLGSSLFRVWADTFFELMVSSIGRPPPVFTVGRIACCILARSLFGSRSQMLTANRSPGTQKFGHFLLVVLIGGLSLSGCA